VLHLRRDQEFGTTHGFERSMEYAKAHQAPFSNRPTP
jgi:hypothetical protein